MATDDWPHEPPAPSNGSKTGDPTAPYGRTATGAPRGKPGPAKGTTTRNRRMPGAPPKVTPRSPSASRAKPDYRPGINGLLQLAAAPLAMFGARTGNVAYQADAAALVAYAPPLAAGLQSVADSDPRVAALLDRVLKAGPYAVILTPLVQLGMQLAVNHGLVPIELGAQVGAMAPQDLITAVTGGVPAGAGVPRPRPDSAGPDDREPDRHDWERAAHAPVPDPVV